MRLLGLSLDGLSEGEYELLLHVEDKTSGRTAERTEPFELASVKAP